MVCPPLRGDNPQALANGSSPVKWINRGIIKESMMGLRPRQGKLRLVFRLFSLMRGLPSIRLK